MAAHRAPILVRVTKPPKRMTPNTALAVAATAVTAIAVGVVVVVTPSGGGDAPTAASTGLSISTVVGDSGNPANSATDSGSGTGAATSATSGSSSTDGSATSSGGSASGSAAQSPASSSAPAGHPTTKPTSLPTPPPTSTGAHTPGTGLDDPRKKETAMELVSSAENSSLDWRAQYKYIEDIHDGRGYTGGIIGFCSGTGDMLEVVQRYTALEPGNVLAKYLNALKADNGSATHNGLDPNFKKDWATAAADPKFQQAQNDERDAEYFTPAVSQAKADGLGALGQFIYYDAMVMHGPGSDPLSFGGIRAAALRKAKAPSQGGDEGTYLNAFLDARIVAMKADPSHQDTSRVDTEQRVFVKANNFDLDTPLHWSVYGDSYTIS